LEDHRRRQFCWLAIITYRDVERFPRVYIGREKVDEKTFGEGTKPEQR
jgi:hypothetical protein